MTKPLSAREKKQYARHKAAIQSQVTGARDHVLAIAAGKLYREEFATFAGFCESVGISRSTAYNWLTQAKMSSMLDTELTGRQANELAKVSPDVRQGVYDAAAADGAPTAEKIGEIHRLLEGMSEADKAELLRQARAEGAKQVSEIGRTDRIEQILRLAHRCRKIHAGLTDIAAEADQLLSAYVAKVSASTEAA